MALSLQSVIDDVRAIVARGQTFDTQILSAVRRSARWLEKNSDWMDMENLVTFTIAASATEIDFTPGGTIVTDGTVLIKAVKLIRLTNTDLDLDNFNPILRVVDPRDYGQVDSSTTPSPNVPQHCWRYGRYKYRLIQIPDQAWTAEAVLLQLADWESMLRGTTDNVPDRMPDLIKYHEELVVAQAMVLLAPSLRMEQKELLMWIDQRDKLLAAALLQEEEARNYGESPVMSFEGRNR